MSNNKIWPTKSDYRSSACQAFLSLHPLMLCLLSGSSLRLFYFNTLAKSWMSTRWRFFSGVFQEVLGLWSTSWWVLWCWRLRQKNRVLVPNVKWDYVSCNKYFSLCNKGIVFDITPSLVTVCMNWIPRHTYGVYLVLYLKPGATKWYQSYVDCRT